MCRLGQELSFHATGQLACFCVTVPAVLHAPRPCLWLPQTQACAEVTGVSSSDSLCLSCPMMPLFVPPSPRLPLGGLERETGLCLGRRVTVKHGGSVPACYKSPSSRLLAGVRCSGEPEGKPCSPVPGASGDCSHGHLWGGWGLLIVAFVF